MPFELNYIEVEFNLSLKNVPQVFWIHKNERNKYQYSKYQDVPKVNEIVKPVCYHLKKKNKQDIVTLSKKEIEPKFTINKAQSVMTLIKSSKDKTKSFGSHLKEFSDLFKIEKKETDNYDIIKNYMEFKVSSICKKKDKNKPKGPVRTMKHVRRSICSIKPYTDVLVFSIDKSKQPVCMNLPEVKRKDEAIIKFNMNYLEEYEELYLLIKEKFNIEEIMEESEVLVILCGRELDVNRLKDLDTLTIFEGISSFIAYEKERNTLS